MRLYFLYRYQAPFKPAVPIVRLCLFFSYDVLEPSLKTLSRYNHLPAARLLRKLNA